MREYCDFDKECFPQKRSTEDSRDYRTQFAIDRDRIIHSRAFRRLQAKTQIFSIGEYDFYHTRLTHSVEVAQIGRSICRFLNHENDKFEVDSDLVEAACLSHDIGNPPFGHSGERTLNRCMKKYGGFEGNAQTLRLLAERMFKSKEEDEGKREGIKPTRALMDAVCKYKDFWTDEKESHFLYKEQKECLQFVHGGDIPFKDQSIECQIMDWSDDIANAYADVNDGIKARLIDISSVEQWMTGQELGKEDKTYIDGLIKSMKDRDIERFRANEIGKCITGVKMIERHNDLSYKTARYAYAMEIEPIIKRRCNLMKDIALQIVIRSAKVQQLEVKTDRMISDLFELFMENYKKSPKSLLPPTVHNEIVSAPDLTGKARVICDHISGMSDDFAVRTYRRLFDPMFGSIGDFI